MTSKSKNVYIDKLNDILNQCNKTWHRAIKMKPAEVKSNTYINSNKEVHYKDPKFKAGNQVRISEYKNVFAKGYTPNCFEELFVFKKVTNSVPWIHFINVLNGEEIIGTFYEKEL